MPKLVHEALTGTRMSVRHGFETNKAGLELLALGGDYFEAVCDCLTKHVAPFANDIANVAAITRRFRGLDYVLQYFVREGLQRQPERLVRIARAFPPALLAATMNAGARIVVSPTTANICTALNCPELLTFIADGLCSSEDSVRRATQRFADAIQQSKRQC